MLRHVRGGFVLAYFTGDPVFMSEKNKYTLDIISNESTPHPSGMHVFDESIMFFPGSRNLSLLQEPQPSPAAARLKTKHLFKCMYAYTTRSKAKCSTTKPSITWS